MTQGKRSLPGIAFIDFLANLLMLFLVLFVLSFVMIQPKTTTPSIETLGFYAVVVSWTSGSSDDVDTYVEDPADNIVYFASPQSGLMHLEQDDLGTGISNTTTVNGTKYKVTQNQERVVIQGIVPGEYTVNVMMYQKRDPGPERITVKLYRLRGPDEVLISQQVVLRSNGDEKTAFRFTLRAGGSMCCVNHLFKEVAYANIGPDGAQGNDTQPPPNYHLGR